MKHLPVTSSNIASISERDPATGDVEVRFKSGATYVHRAVPLETYENLMSAKSKGGFYHEHLKGRYGVSKV